MFETERIVEFSMCDSAGILFFSKIFDLTHSAYEELVLRSDLKEDYFVSVQYAIPLVSASANYLAPIALHEVIGVSILVSEIGTSSFQLTTSFTDDVGNEKAIVKTTHVFISKTNSKKTEIPGEFITLLNEHKV